MARPTLPSPRSSPERNETSASPSPQTDGQRERFCDISSRRCPSPLTGSIRRLVDKQAPTRRASREVVHSRSHDTTSGEATRARSRPGNKDRRAASAVAGARSQWAAGGRRTSVVATARTALTPTTASDGSAAAIRSRAHTWDRGHPGHPERARLSQSCLLQILGPGCNTARRDVNL